MRVKVGSEDMFPLAGADVVVKVTDEQIHRPRVLVAVEIYRGGGA